MSINSTMPALSVQRCEASCGALVRGVDLTRALEPAIVAAIRQVWLDHQVIAFPDQAMSIEDLERFAHYMGPFGEDPYIEAMPGHPHVVQVKREPDEKTKIFAETWHSDWSFLPTPPAGTVLFGNIIPPIGGNTLFSNQYDAWDALPDAMKSRLKGKMGVHSARLGYARDGAYGAQDRSAGRSMAIRFDDSALKTRSHPIARVHPETGRTALFVSPGYTIGIEDTEPAEAKELLLALFDHQRRSEFVYSHTWSANMLVMWDNRCLVHAATGGYEGHRRLLHRVTVAEKAKTSQ